MGRVWRRLTAELRDEDLDGRGEAFPHLYGPLDLDAVVQVLPFEPAEGGRFTLPAALGAGTSPHGGQERATESGSLRDQYGDTEPGGRW